MKQKTFSKSCDFTVTIKDNFCIGNLYEEEIAINLEDEIRNYICENIDEFFNTFKIEISNVKIASE